MLGQLPAGISLAELNAAWSYVSSKMRAALQLPGKLHAKQMEAAGIARAAEVYDNIDLAMRARDLVRSYGEIKLEAQDIASRVQSLKESVPGLGAVPVALLAVAGTVIALAVSLRAIFRKESEHERELKLLEQGIDPEIIRQIREEAGTNGGPLAGLPETAKYLALAALAIVGLPILGKVIR